MWSRDRRWLMFGFYREYEFTKFIQFLVHVIRSFSARNGISVVGIDCCSAFTMLLRILVVFALLLSDFSTLKCVIERLTPAARNGWATARAVNTTQLYEIDGTHQHKHKQIFRMNPGHTAFFDWLSVDTSDLPCITTPIADVNNHVHSSVGHASLPDIVCFFSGNIRVHPLVHSGRLSHLDISAESGTDTRLQGHVDRHQENWLFKSSREEAIVCYDIIVGRRNRTQSWPSVGAIYAFPAIRFSEHSIGGQQGWYYSWHNIRFQPRHVRTDWNTGGWKRSERHQTGPGSGGILGDPCSSGFCHSTESGRWPCSYTSRFNSSSSPFRHCQCHSINIWMRNVRCSKRYEHHYYLHCLSPTNHVS